MRAAIVTLALVLAAGPARAAGFTLRSDSLKNGAPAPAAQVLNQRGCTGGNLSPALSWSEPPSKTRSLAVTLFDRDAQGGAGFWHWAVVDLPPTTRGLPSDAGHAGRLPRGAVELRDDFGLVGYGGPCPPPGDPPHRFDLTVWALDVARVPRNLATAAAAAGFLDKHSLALAAITVTYGR